MKIKQQLTIDTKYLIVIHVKEGLPVEQLVMAHQGIEAVRCLQHLRELGNVVCSQPDDLCPGRLLPLGWNRNECAQVFDVPVQDVHAPSLPGVRHSSLLAHTGQSRASAPGLLLWGWGRVLFWRRRWRRFWTATAGNTEGIGHFEGIAHPERALGVGRTRILLLMTTFLCCRLSTTIWLFRKYDYYRPSSTLR